MKQYDQTATDEQINNAVIALGEHGIHSEVVENGKEALELIKNSIPEGSEVFTATSVTLDTIGADKFINESGKYDAVKPKLMKMDRATESGKMQKVGSAPTYTIGSVHAVTEDGHVFIASNTGSQLSSYVYGSEHVTWIVGTQKIVKNNDEAFKRIYDYVLPLESDRAHKAYGMPGSFVSKLLIVNKEVKPNRIKVIFVKEKLGF